MELGRDRVMSRGFDDLSMGGTKFTGSSRNDSSGGNSPGSIAWCRDHDENRRGPQERDSAHHQRLSLGQPLDGYTTSQATQQQQQQPADEGDHHCTEASVYYPRGNRNKPVKWSAEEDRRLREAVQKFSEARWKDIARMVGTRNHVQCLQRWKKVLKPGLVKGQWSPEEDDQLVRLVERGFRNWGQVASFMDGRTSKQCRERWCHHLDPAVRKGGYTPEEDDLIVFLQGEVGNRWADIAKRLTGRTENAVKIRWKALNRRQRDARNKATATARATSLSVAGVIAGADDTEAGESLEQPISPLSAGIGPGLRREKMRGRGNPATSALPRGLDGSVKTVSAAAMTAGSSKRVIWEEPDPTFLVSNKGGGDAEVRSKLTKTSESGSLQGLRPPTGKGMPPQTDCTMPPSTNGSREGAVETGRHGILAVHSQDVGEEVPFHEAGISEGKWIARKVELGIRRDSRAISLHRRDFTFSEGKAAVEEPETFGASRPFPGEFRVRSRRRPGLNAARDEPGGRSGGGLYRLCAAMRNVEAMDNLRLAGDNEAVDVAAAGRFSMRKIGDDDAVDAAAAAAAERFRMRKVSGSTYNARRAEDFVGAASLTGRSTPDSPYTLRLSPRLLPPLRAPTPQGLPLSTADNNCRTAAATAHGYSSATAVHSSPRAVAEVSLSVPGAINGKVPQLHNPASAAQPLRAAGEPEGYSTMASAKDGILAKEISSHAPKTRDMTMLRGKALGFHYLQPELCVGVPSLTGPDGGQSFSGEGGETMHATVTCCKRPRNGHPIQAYFCEGEGEVRSGERRELRMMPAHSYKKARSPSEAPPSLRPPSTVVAIEAVTTVATAMSQASATLAAAEFPALTPPVFSRAPLVAGVDGVTLSSQVTAVPSAPCSVTTTTTAA